MTKRIVDESLLRQVLEALEIEQLAIAHEKLDKAPHVDNAITALRSALDGDTELNLNCKSVQKRLAARWTPRAGCQSGSAPPSCASWTLRRKHGGTNDN